jgi:hypothetical protein
VIPLSASTNRPVCDGFDEGKVVLFLGALGDGEGLALGLRGKALGAEVWNSDFNGVKACGAQGLTVLLHTAPGTWTAHAIDLVRDMEHARWARYMHYGALAQACRTARRATI